MVTQKNLKLITFLVAVCHERRWVLNVMKNLQRTKILRDSHGNAGKYLYQCY